jgi:hypothetical protein
MNKELSSVDMKELPDPVDHWITISKNSCWQVGVVYKTDEVWHIGFLITCICICLDIKKLYFRGQVRQQVRRQIHGCIPEPQKVTWQK